MTSRSVLTWSTPSPSASPSSQTCCWKKLAGELQPVGVGRHPVGRAAEVHLVEGDLDAVIDRPVGAFLHLDMLDAARHPGQRDRHHHTEVARFSPVPCRSCARRRSPAAALPARRVPSGPVEGERGGDQVCARSQDRSGLGDAGVARCVEHGVDAGGVDLLGGGDPDRFPAREFTRVAPDLLVGVHLDPGQFEVGMVEDAADRSTSTAPVPHCTTR